MASGECRGSHLGRRQHAQLRIAPKPETQGHAPALGLFLLAAAGLQVLQAKQVILSVAQGFAQGRAAVEHGVAHGLDQALPEPL